MRAARLRTAEAAWRGEVGRATPPVEIRPLAADDSIEAITILVHRAFARLGAMGLRCPSVDQTVARTRERVAAGTCLVATSDARLVGTITVHDRDETDVVPWYRQRGVASAHQLAVDPDAHGAGIGRALLAAASAHALRRGHCELALDTPAPASHLVAFYRRGGFRPVEWIRLGGRNYTSLVLSAALANADR